MADTKRGFGLLRCPLCGAEGTISLDLDEVTHETSLQCRECEETFGVDTVRDTICAWNMVLAWINSAPALKE